MNILQVLNDQVAEPTDYTARPTVKAVILNDKNEVLLFGGSLVGGGVEDGETLEQALDRECLEEVGAVIRELKPLGMVIQYRDEWKKRYEIQGYLAKFVETRSAPTTKSESELSRSLSWKTIAEAKQLLRASLEELNAPEERAKQVGDAKQASRFNTQTSLTFLEEAEKQM